MTTGCGGGCELGMQGRDPASTWAERTGGGPGCVGARGRMARPSLTPETPLQADARALAFPSAAVGDGS